MKYLIAILAILSLISIIAGAFLTFEYSEKFIGGGVVGLFFIVFPLFIYHRWKNKSFKDYMLNQENFDKMRNHGKDL